MKKISIVMALMLFLVACGSDSATIEAKLDQAQKYCDEANIAKDFEKGQALIKKMAKKGNTEAMSMLGRASFYGNYCGIKQDYTEAIKWLTKGAEGGNIGAMIALSFAYSFGNGVPENSKEALKWMARANANSTSATKINKHDSQGLKRLKEEISIDANSSEVYEIVSSDKSKDITPWLKENIHNYDPLLLFVFTQRLVNEKATVKEVGFWLEAAIYRAHAYMLLCRADQSGEGALFSSFSVLTSEKAKEAYKDTKQMKEFIKNIDANVYENAQRLFEWDTKNKIPNNFCGGKDLYTKEEREKQIKEIQKERFAILNK